MAKGLGLEIYSFEELSSTQLWLCEQIRTQNLFPPLAVVAKRQKDGIGSRGNQWEETKEALTFSFALPITSLPKDLPLVSSSLFLAIFLKKFSLKEAQRCGSNGLTTSTLESGKWGA